MLLVMSRRIRAKEFDLALLCTVLIISILGIFAIFSAVHSGDSGNDRLWLAQIIRLAVALVAMAVAVFVDYRILHGFSYAFYGVWFLLLSILLFFQEQSGVRRWFMKGAIQHMVWQNALLPTEKESKTNISSMRKNMM